MVALSWATALLRRRPGRIAGPAAGVAVAVAFVAALGAFAADARSTMTTDAVRQVPVDWQVEVQPGGTAGAVARSVARRPDVQASALVGFAATSGLEATTGHTTQTTGPGVIVGLPDDYRTTFPGELRTLAGASRGVLIAQQAAANLHVGPGDVVRIGRAGRTPIAVRVDGIVDLPAADSLFQRVGAPAGAQPQAPPDNVVLLPAGRWRTGFATPSGAVAPRFQVHVRLDHRLPGDPAAAFARTLAAGHRLEADLAGEVLVGNNLAATLDAARSDALYAEILFLLLGLPAVCLAALLTRAVAAAAREARRQEAALLRTRGASLATIQRTVVAEALAVAAGGGAAGAVLAWAERRYLAPAGQAPGAIPGRWVVGAVAAGLAVTAVAVAVPGWRDAGATPAAGRRAAVRRASPLPLRYGLDVAALVAGIGLVWASSRGHYALVLAPEGVPTLSVSWWALAGPALLWVGLGLLAWRLTEALLGHGRAVVRSLLGPLVGQLRGPAAATLRRERRALATGVALLALSLAFAASTAVFTATYHHQVGVDALLTNGAPVTVVETPAPARPAAEARRIGAVAGVGHVEPLMHRFVYVGADLQDLYGVDPSTIGAAGQLQDAYFAGGGARALLSRLAREPEAALVSVETVQDFQLRLGDRLRLRLTDASTGRLVPVDFRYAGVVKEFPTAPSDSFVVANAAYVARKAGAAPEETFLVTTRRAGPPSVARQLQHRLGPAARITDVDASRRVVGSTLTAVDLGRLARLELAYAVVLVAAASGLVLALGLAQRRRSLAIVAALGATSSQQAAFARAEAAVLTAVGGALGAAYGWILATVLVKVLSGVFDPPPATLAVPWRYLAVVAVLGLLAVSVAVLVQRHALRRPLAELVRDL